MPRPILDERMTVRMPGELLGLILDSAARRNCSANDVVLNALENQYSHIVVHSADFYRDVLPMVVGPQGDIGGHRRTIV